MATPGTASADSDSPRKLRVVMAQLDFLVGDIPGNTELVLKATRQAHEQHKADIVLFPELCLTGYPPEDLLLRPSLDLRITEALERLQQANLEPAMVIGAPISRRMACASSSKRRSLTSRIRRNKLSRSNFEIRLNESKAD